MYTIVSTYGISKVAGSTWGAIDLTGMTGVRVFTDLDGLYLTLTTPTLTGEFVINIQDYSALLSQDTREITEIFTAWDDPTPLKVSPLPNYRSARVIYTDAIRADYMPQKSIAGAHYTSGKPSDIKTELQLSREGTDMRKFAQHVLVSVNGLLYRVEANADTAYVPEAGKSLIRSGINQIGLVSFETIGQIQTFGIEDSVLPHGGDSLVTSGANIALPDTDLTGKTLLLVLAGYLHWPSQGLYRMISNERALVKLQLMELVERYKETVHRMDWSTIVGDSNPSDVYLDGNHFFTDDAVKALFAHPQTFWVVVDTPSLSFNKTPIQALPMPGNYIMAKEPTEVLVTGHGLILDYWKMEEEGEWGVYTSGFKPGRSVNSSVGKDLWSGRFSVRDLPGAVFTNSPASILSIVANQIDA